MGFHAATAKLCLFEALYPAPLARPFSKGLLARGCLIWAFMPLRLIVPLRGTLSCAFGAALLQGPTRRGLSHMGFHTATTNCASPRHSILRLWRAPSPRTYSRGTVRHLLSYCRQLTICLLFSQSLRRCAGGLLRGRSWAPSEGCIWLWRCSKRSGRYRPLWVCRRRGRSLCRRL